MRYRNPMAERPYHHGSLRSALLEAAEKALDRGSAQDLSLRELARELGVSHAAPRRHFEDRQALLDALAEDGFRRLGRSLDRAAGSADQPFEVRLQAVARAYFRFATRHSPLLELMYAGKHRPGAEELQRTAHEALAAPLEVVVQGQREGILPAGDPMEQTTLAWAALHGLASVAAAGLVDPGQHDHLVRAMVHHLLHGLTTPLPATADDGVPAPGR